VGQGREHVVRSDHTGPILRRTRRTAMVFALLCIASIAVDVVVVRTIGSEWAWWMRTPFFFLLAPTFAYYALLVARFLPRMRGEYAVRVDEDRVVASWDGARTAEVLFADPISLRRVWWSDRAFLVATPRGKVMLHPELEGLEELVAELRARGLRDDGLPLSQTHAFVGADVDRREPLPDGVAPAELARLGRLERIAGTSAVIGLVVGVSAGLMHALALLAAGFVVASIGGGVAMAARGRYIARHGVYRFVGGTILVRERTQARRVGAVLVVCGSTIAALGALAALVCLVAGLQWLAG
jgi:hypothetical protein